MYYKGIFSIESIKINNELSNKTQYLCLHLDSLNKIRCLKNHSLYLKLIVLLSADISLNPWSNRTNHQLTENLKVFKNRGLYFIHLNINSLLSKIDELREIVPKNIKCESCWNYWIETRWPNKRDRNTKGGRVVWYVNNKICLNVKNFISNEL